MSSKYNYDLTKLLNGLDSLDIPYDEDKLDKLISFYEMVVEKNKVMNLTGITDFDEFVEKHFIDSLILAKAYPDISKNKFVIDVGTGAGFPGIPLSIIYNNSRFVLLDSLNKRINFINEVISSLSLRNVETIAGRAEDYARNPLYREQFDLCVTRAVAEINLLSEYTLPFVKLAGECIFYKSSDIDEELHKGSNAITILGGNIDNVVKVKIPGTDYERSLVVINKSEPTPDKYPRKAGTPKKKPLK